MEKYGVWHLIDNVYQVFEWNPDDDEYTKFMFQGTLSECEAWIKLKRNPDVSF